MENAGRHYWFAGPGGKQHAKTMDPNSPAVEFKTAWEAAQMERQHHGQHGEAVRHIGNTVPRAALDSLAQPRPSKESENSEVGQTATASMLNS